MSSSPMFHAAVVTTTVIDQFREIYRTHPGITLAEAILVMEGRVGEMLAPVEIDEHDTILRTTHDGVGRYLDPRAGHKPYRLHDGREWTVPSGPAPRPVTRA